MLVPVIDEIPTPAFIVITLSFRTVIFPDVTLALPSPTPFLIKLLSNVNVLVPSLFVPVTVIVYWYPLVTLVFVISVTLTLLFDTVMSVVFKL